MPQDDITVRTASASKTEKKRKKIKLSKSKLKKLLIVVLAIGLLGGVYYLGDRRGASRQKAYDKKHPFGINGRSGAAGSVSPKNRWTSVGTVTDVNEKSIKVKNAKGDVSDGAITKDTIITDKTGKKTDIKSIKKDMKVVASGTKDDKGALTATRIRLEQ